MVLGQPLFTGSNGIDQGVEIFRVLGTPSNAELRAMNPNYPRTYNFNPNMPKLRWADVLKKRCDDDGCDLADQLIRYDPGERMPPMTSLMHRYFDSLRASENPNVLCPLFDFNAEELCFCNNSEREKLVPAWYVIKQEKIKKEEVKVEQPGSAPSSSYSVAAASPV